MASWRAGGRIPLGNLSSPGAGASSSFPPKHPATWQVSLEKNPLIPAPVALVRCTVCCNRTQGRYESPEGDRGKDGAAT